MLGNGLRLLVALTFLAGCGEETQVARQAPLEPTRADIGYYCNMIVVDHPGPKAQLFLKGAEEPIWFSSVRDAIAFTLLPDEPKAISAIYVNDMTEADWEKPEAGTWISAEAAIYVISSNRRGGMGALETVPFGDREAAAAFAAEFGGKIVALKDVPQDYVLSADLEPAEMTEMDMQHGETGHGHDAAHE